MFGSPHPHTHKANTRARFALCLVFILACTGLWPGQALAEKLYKWKDKSGQTHITSNFPSKSLRMKGSKVEIIDSNARNESNVVVKTEELSDEQKQEISVRKSKRREIESERRKLDEEKDYLSRKVRKLKIDLRRLEKKLAKVSSADDEVTHQERLAEIKSKLADDSGRLRTVELRILRLRQELENLK